MTTVLSSLLALALLSSPDPQAQPVTQANPPATRVDDVVVSGRRTDEVIREFVNEVTGPPPGRGPARWDRQVCVGVVNLRNDLAQMVVDRVSDVAMEIGLRTGAPGCRPNVTILVTDDGAALATALAERRPLAFRPGYSKASHGRAAFNRFKASDRAIRWWHVAIPIHQDTGQIAVRMPGEIAPDMNTTRGLLRHDIQNDLLRAYIIVDTSKLVDVSWAQVADHVAMVALAEIDPDAEISHHDTVLNLSGASGRNGLTEWDWGYLRSLYTAELNQRAPTHQTATVSSIMTHDWRRETEPARAVD